jgi:hypothetical protein
MLRTVASPYSPDAEQGSLTRGMSVFQEPGGKRGLVANVQLVRRVCMERFKALMEAATD